MADRQALQGRRPAAIDWPPRSLVRQRGASDRASRRERATDARSAPPRQGCRSPALSERVSSVSGLSLLYIRSVWVCIRSLRQVCVCFVSGLWPVAALFRAVTGLCQVYSGLCHMSGLSDRLPYRDTSNIRQPCVYEYSHTADGIREASLRPDLSLIFYRRERYGAFANCYYFLYYFVMTCLTTGRYTGTFYQRVCTDVLWVDATKTRPDH